MYLGDTVISFSGGLVDPADLNGTAGAVRWKYATSNVELDSPAIGSDGTVNVGSWDSNMCVCICVPCPDDFAHGMHWFMHDHGIPYVLECRYAFEGSTGALNWKFATLGYILSSAAIGADGTVYFGSEDSSV